MKTPKDVHEMAWKVEAFLERSGFSAESSWSESSAYVHGEYVIGEKWNEPKEGRHWLTGKPTGVIDDGFYSEVTRTILIRVSDHPVPASRRGTSTQKRADVEIEFDPYSSVNTYAKLRKLVYRLRDKWDVERKAFGLVT